jgi:hypothetical protein
LNPVRRRSCKTATRASVQGTQRLSCLVLLCSSHRVGGVCWSRAGSRTEVDYEAENGFDSDKGEWATVVRKKVKRSKK